MYVHTKVVRAINAATCHVDVRGGAKVLKFRPVSLMDSPNMIGGEALRPLIPVDWQFDGEVVWRNNPSYPASVKLRVFKSRDVEEIGAMPNLLFYWNPL